MRFLPTRQRHPRSRRLLGILVGLALVLVGIRVALPYFLLQYVNRTLAELPDYRGEVRDIDLALFRGAYRIEGLNLRKASGKIPEPFFSAASIDLSMQWKELLRGSLVSEIEVLKPELNFIPPPPKASPAEKKARSQTHIDASWTDKVEKLAPFKINRFSIRDGRITFKDPHRTPKVDLDLRNVEAEATNLTNSSKLSKTMFAEVKAKAMAQGHAPMRLDMRIDPYRKEPTFDLESELTGLRLPELNDFFKAYAKLDVESGTFGLFAEAAAQNGAFKGYLKPVIKNLNIFKPEADDSNVLEMAWEAFTEAAGELFENQRKERVATRIPFEGKLPNADPAIWPTVGYLLRNAFLEALKPQLDKDINLATLGKDPPSKDKPSRKKPSRDEKEKPKDDKKSARDEKKK